MSDASKKLNALLIGTQKAAKTILENVNEGKTISVYSHMDADGLSASGILGTALTRIGASYRIRIERWFNDNVANEIASQKDVLAVLTDMGSGYLEILNKTMKGRSLVILDHHQSDTQHNEDFIHVNPGLFGMDGARDLSGAGIAYLTAKSFSEKNIDLACIGVVGALGDLQDKNDGRKLRGANTILVEDGIKAGYLRVETDLLFFGRETRPIHKALAYTTNPYIPGISGEEDKSLATLIGLGIKPKKGEKWRALRDLTKQEKRDLFSKLSDYLVSKGYKSDAAMSLLGNIYVLNGEEPWTPLRDAREFALLLNATGRTGKPSLGVAICLGDRGKCLAEAIQALVRYRKTIAGYLRWIDRHPDRFEEMESIYVLHGGETINEKVISAISTILSSNLSNIEKPIIGYSLIPKEKIMKVSARTIMRNVKKGLNLGEIMNHAAEKYDGNGGGHDVAAGAQVPIKARTDFLELVDKLVKLKMKDVWNDGS